MEDENRLLAPERAIFLMEDFSRGFIRYVGIEAQEARWGAFVSGLSVRPEHRQQDGFIHAGVLAAMADHTAGYAAFTAVSSGIQILTIEFKVNFLRPAAGQGLICRSRVIRHGRRVMIGESDVFDLGESGERHAARALVTLMPVPVEDLAGRG
ncbi:MAG: PaaI family thioesterase [Proteobacteria bacterium]|nr:PaaI family thioesterase [Pseudomonadota bacterium]